MALRHNIHDKRKALGMTLEELAQKIGTSKQTVQRYESGVISNIPSDRIEKIAEVFNCSPADLMGWQENKPAENDELILDIFKRLNEDDRQMILDLAHKLASK